MEEIDWCSKWQEDRQRYTIVGNAAKDTEYWNRYWSRKDDLRDDQTERRSWILARLPLQSNSTVIDVGCGDGDLTVPVAGKVKMVTALDASSAALARLAAQVKSRGLSNIRSVNLPWTQVSLGQDVEPHDIVVASFVLATLDLRQALPLLDDTAKQAVFIFDSAGPRYWYYPELWPAIFNREFIAKPDYIYIVNALHQLGIYANVEIGQYEAVTCATTPDKVIDGIIDRLKISTPKAKSIIMDYVTEKLMPQAGGYCLRHSQRIAMISWRKKIIHASV